MANKTISPPNGFSDGFIKHLKAQDKRYDVADKSCKGLRIRVGTSGKKAFVWFYNDPETNKLKMLTLGRYGDGDDQLTLSAARKALEAAKIKLDAGELHTIKATTPKTVSELCEVFYNDRILPHRRAPEAVMQVINHDINPIIGSKNITTISAVAIANCVQLVVNRGAAVHANKVLAILKQLFKFAEARGYIERSPAYSLDKKDLGVVTNQRDRWLEAHEIKLVWDAINNAPRMSLPVKNGLKMLFLTGVRTGEVRKAKWEHINFEKKEWFIPKENTKSFREWTVPLTPNAMSLLAEMQGLHSDYIFCGQNGMISEKAMARALKRLFKSGVLTIESVTPHDLRSTLRTHVEKLGVAPHIAEKCISHSLGALNGIYNKNSYLDERREALERWNEFVSLQVTEKTNVIHIRKAG